MKKKVLFIRSNPVKPDSRVEKEVKALINNGYLVTVLAWDRSNNYPLQKDILNDNMNEVDTYRIGIKSQFGSGLKNLKHLVKFQIAIKAFLNNYKFDIVHACDFDTAFTSYHVINHRQTKFVYDIFDYYIDAFSVPSKLKGFIKLLDRQIIDGADLTIICTEQRRKQIKGAKPKKLIVIHNSPPEIDIGEQSKRNISVVRIAYFGILAEGRLIKELVDIIAKDKRFELHIGGFGLLEEYVRNYALNNTNIVYYGRVPYKKVLELEQKCDIITAIYDPAVKNHYYAAPNKFYEALMLGKPVIMAKNTGMSDIVADNDIGITIDYSYVGLQQGLNSLFMRIHNDEDFSAKMKEIYTTQFSWEEMEKRLIEAYELI